MSPPFDDSETEVACESCGGVVRRFGTSEISLKEGGPDLPGAECVREQMRSKQVLCWSCMNDSITRFLSS
jgi:hypothetical protein